jgi:hypothetical protein
MKSVSNVMNMLVLNTGETGFGENDTATFGGAIIVTDKAELQMVLMQTSTVYTESVRISDPTADESHSIVVAVNKVGLHEDPP